MAVVSIKNKLRRGNLLVGNEAYDPGGMVPIATTVVGSGGTTSAIEFTSIPSTYSHLQLRWIARTNRASFPDYLRLRFNSDSGTNYSYHLLYGNGSSASASATTTVSSIELDGAATGAAQSASIFAAGVIDILDYKDTNKYKTTRHLLGWDGNGSGSIYFSSGNWRNTNAITSVAFALGSGTTIQEYSSFALYGIKSA